MSDETPDTPTPETPKTPETPETPAAPETPPTPAAQVPTEPTPAAAAPVAASPAPTPAPAPAPAPVAAAPVTTTGPRKSVAIPTWLVITIGVLLVGGLLFGSGFALGRNGRDDNNQAQSNNGFQLPNLGNGGSGNGNGGNTFPQQTPQTTPRQQTPQTPQTTPRQQTPSTPSTSGAFLGVATQQTDNGLEITQVVSGSAADTAGLQVGDVITAVDGTNVTTPAQLSAAISSSSPGDTVRISYTNSSGQTKTVNVKLGSRQATSSN